MTTTPQFLSSPQAAQILCVSVRTVHRYVAAGDLAPIMTAPGGPHGAFLFDAETVQALAQKLRAA